MPLFAATPSDQGPRAKRRRWTAMPGAQADIRITIGGDAGQGVESSGAMLSQALARGGWHVFSVPDYRSRIRGGHNFFQIRAAGRPCLSHSDPVHLLLALTRETIDVHVANLAPGAGVIYDDGFRLDAPELESRGMLPLSMPLAKIAEQHGNKLMLNTAALAAAAGILDLPLDVLESLLRDTFGAKGTKVVEGNLHVARAAYRFAKERYSGRLPYSLPPKAGPGAERLVLSGNEAFCLGAVAGGCTFVAAYPMTPATPILEWMAAHERDVGVVTKHAEDEIAAICMAVGAGFVGARAMVPTSGGGLSLMTEALGMAGMCEVPVVVVNVQRGGPSTGLPTRTEQGDLLFMLHAAQGEFPRIVLAPGTHEQYFEAGWRAFNLAEKYQCPVIVLSDQFLAASRRSLEKTAVSPESVTIDRGQLLTAEDLERLEKPYRRYAMTASGVSPRALPGHPQAVFTATTDEHGEDGHITEDMDLRVNMMDKRMRKLETAAAEMRGPAVYGPKDAELTIICWGSTVGPARESLPLLLDRGVRANVLHFTDIWPFPQAPAERALHAVRRAVCVEQNHTGQFGRFLRMMTGFTADGHVRKYDGRPFSPQQIAAGVLKEVGVRA
ncbi:MAG: 2-oxoacid:acceptor oxidoreductase subunit alpha [Firmicutes bacterium]|nr:2-oxoacid:acceptor oxidoreductase subunit alpha [Bacillota bacterium]